MGYSKPTPIQAQTIPIALMGRDICACAETGAEVQRVVIIVLSEMRSSRAVVSCYTSQARVRQQPSCSPFLSVFYTVPNAFSRYVYQLLIARHYVIYCHSDQYIFTVDSHINADARAHTPADARVGRPVRRGC